MLKFSHLKRRIVELVIFRLMGAVSQHTRVGPPGRIQRLLQFNQRLQNTPDSIAVFTDWDLELDTNLVELRGRVLENEVILVGDGRS